MFDINILALFGYDTNNLVFYGVADEDETQVTINVKRKVSVHFCPKCKQTTIIIHDYYTKSYTLTSLSTKTIHIIFHQRRYKCKYCGKTFVEENPFIKNGNYKLNLNLIKQIIVYLKETMSCSSIARLVNVSDRSVIKVLNDYSTPVSRKLPEVLCIDEFASYRERKKFHYPCLLIDFKAKKIVDLLSSRDKKSLREYLLKKPKQEIESIKYLSMDMHQDYKDVFLEFNKNIIVMIDSFHFIRYALHGLDMVRIRVMKSFDESSIAYILLKKYARSLDKKEPNNLHKFRVRYLGNSYYYETDVIEIMCQFSFELEKAYEYVHTFIKQNQEWTYKEALLGIKRTYMRFQNSGIPELVAVGKTYENWYQEICNSYLEIDDGVYVSNGLIEGFNNKIKKIKSVCYGITNFKHLKNRVFLIFNNNEPRKKL
ncbi:MAG: ISL3 family transposase [Bacilli bacterium]